MLRSFNLYVPGLDVCLLSGSGRRDKISRTDTGPGKVLKDAYICIFYFYPGMTHNFSGVVSHLQFTIRLQYFGMWTGPSFIRPADFGDGANLFKLCSIPFNMYPASPITLKCKNSPLT